MRLVGAGGGDGVDRVVSTYRRGGGRGGGTGGVWGSRGTGEGSARVYLRPLTKNCFFITSRVIEIRFRVNPYFLFIFVAIF